jgi:acetate kinase
MKILVLNAGSSSHKSCLYELVGESLPAHPPQPLWEAQVTGLGGSGVRLTVKTANGAWEEMVPATSRPQLIAHMLDTLVQGQWPVLKSLAEIDVVGHRVVHGGRDYRQSTLVTSDVKRAIADLATLAPTHNPANLQGIEVTEELIRGVPQLVVFDTAFHATIPEKAAIYPGPYEWVEQGIRRYGFHGISHQYCEERAAQILGRELASLRLITCHLGNGCSLCAIKNGCSIDTTMGFTPLEGLMMGTRSGSIDPGIITYLLREKGYDATQLDRLLNTESGLKGISGISGDMREITAAMQRGEARAKLALDIYVYRLRAAIGAMLPALGGLDALVFTAGVGENSALIRAACCEAFGFLGLEIDSVINEASPVDQDIATGESKVHVLVIHTEEDWAIARECWTFAMQQNQ